jgi:hypothetical protein
MPVRQAEKEGRRTMKNSVPIWSLAVLVAVAFLPIACNQQQNPPSTEEPAQPTVASPEVNHESAATQLVDGLSRGDFTGVEAMFDATMKAALPEAALGQTWEGITQQLGAFKKRAGTRTTTEAGMTAVYVTCEFERAKVAATVVFNANGEVAGLFFQ